MDLPVLENDNAHIVANELSREVRITSGPVIDKPRDLAGLLTNLQEGEILFIDEIHRIPKTVEEYYTRDGGFSYRHHD